MDQALMCQDFLTYHNNLLWRVFCQYIRYYESRARCKKTARCRVIKQTAV